MEDLILEIETVKGYGHLSWTGFKDHEDRLNKVIACLSGEYEPKPGELMLHSTGKDVTIVQGNETQDTLSILKKNKDSILTTGKTQEGTTPKLLINTSKGTVSITDFVKTEYFGGGSGKGAGSEQTVYQEAGQCIVCSAFLENQKLSNVQDIVDVGTHLSLGEGLDIESTLNKVKELCKSNDAWNKTLIDVAKLLLDKGYGDATFRYGSGANPEPAVTPILEAFKRCKTPGSFDRNKWNPADIWATREGWEYYVEKIKNIPQGAPIQDLNNIISEAFNKKVIIGISHKRASHGHLSYKAFNVGDSFSVDKLIVSKIDCKPNPRQQSGMNIGVKYVEDGVEYEDILTFRKSSGSLRAEKKEDKRKNKEALHGNMGLEPILHYLSKFKLTSIENAIDDIQIQGVLEELYRTKDNCIVTFLAGSEQTILEAEKRGGKAKVNVTDVFKDNRTARSLRDLYRKYFNMDDKEIASIILREDTTDVATKYTCLYILDQLGVESFNDTKNTNLHSLIKSCYMYTSSETDISAPFIKIS